MKPYFFGFSLDSTQWERPRILRYRKTNPFKWGRTLLVGPLTLTITLGIPPGAN